MSALLGLKTVCCAPLIDCRGLGSEFQFVVTFQSRFHDKQQKTEAFEDDYIVQANGIAASFAMQVADNITIANNKMQQHSSHSGLNGRPHRCQP